MDKVKLIKQRKNKLYEQVKEGIIEIIVEKGLAPHDPIPSEGQLAEQFDVSRMTSKMAIQALEEEGILYRLPRRGTFVADINTGALQYNATRSGKEPLKNKAKQLISLILPMIDDFTGNILHSVEQSCSQHGYHLVVKLSEDLENEEQILQEMSASPDVAGIILFPRGRKVCGEQLMKLRLAKYPIVILDRSFKEIDFDCVLHDHYLAAYQITQYLIDHGHTRIGFLTNQMDVARSREERYQGYIQALVDSHVGIYTKLIHSVEETNGMMKRVNLSEDPVIEVLMDYLKNSSDMTAVCCTEDILAIKLVYAAEKLGIRIPQDLSVTGFTDNKVIDMYPLPLTTVKQPTDLFGESAMDLLMGRLENPDLPLKTIKLETTIVENKSVDRII
ncbi:GntR family transcriptional regulator [Paenibacillus sp. FSL L8-0708]|uniref:GntR family transcriptional regulator n=1 Tax=Paenibacillus sp. FSL L8-0708 TaxID=2975311 RepID=UPI0030FB9DC7